MKKKTVKAWAVVVGDRLLTASPLREGAEEVVQLAFLRMQLEAQIVRCTVEYTLPPTKRMK